MMDDSEVFYADTFFEPIEDDSTLYQTPVETKHEEKKAKHDFTAQKKITQTLRTKLENDSLIRVTQSSKKLRPGLLNCGVRRVRHDVNLLAKFPESIEKLTGPPKMKAADKAKLVQLRHRDNPLEKLINTDLSEPPPVLKETEWYRFREPGYDMKRMSGSTAYEIRTSELAQRVRELTEVQATIKKFESAIAAIDLEEKSEKELFTFEGNPEETCARTRPLVSRIPRPIMKVKFDDNREMSNSQFNAGASKYAPCSFNINPYTQLQDVNPDFIIQDIMGMKAYQYCPNPMLRLAAETQHIPWEELFVPKDHKEPTTAISKRVISKDVKQKGDENIKMVIKRLVPPNYKRVKTSEEPTYEISKKKPTGRLGEGEPATKKPKAPRKPRAKKQTEADVLSMDEIRRSALPPAAFRKRKAV